MQRVVDSAVGVAKESVKTVSREAFNTVINTVNGMAALILTLVPNRGSIMEGLQGFELRPTFRAPRVPRWLDDGASSLNKFIYDFADESPSDSEYESGAEDQLSNVSSMPSSPSSSMSSYHSSASHVDRRPSQRRPRSFLSQLLRLLWWFFLPITIWFPSPFSNDKGHHRQDPLGSGMSPVARRRALSRSSSSSSLSQSISLASSELSKKLSDVMGYVVHLNDNRRRGIIEDLQLLMELAIDRTFEMVRTVMHVAISPIQTLTYVLDSLMGRPVQQPRHQQASGRPSVEVTRLGSGAGQMPRQQPMRLHEALNMDARSCEDIVKEAGYPYEAMRVCTDDGYMLALERIPRRDSQKVVLLQHGLLDTALGWVSNGVVGSQAFAAYDQGFDVWLGNMRGYALREHRIKGIPATKYWRYSVNEHGMYDIGAIVRCIHETKLEELAAAGIGTEGRRMSREGQGQGQPYVLAGVAHSLGGAAMLLYLVTQRILQRPHRLSRLILLSPAGFHEKTPLLFDVLRFLVPYIDPFMSRFVPGFYIPTRGLRLLFNKLTQDFQNLPALRALVQVTFSSICVGGDSSDWVGALRQPHYNMYDMPGLSYRVMKHMSQMKGHKRFTMYDYGSAAANRQHYGQPEPLDLGAHYHLIDIPIDVVAGRKDHLIPPQMVLKHYKALKAAGRVASIKEFEYAHLDFTFAHKEELLAYVMARLALTSAGIDAATRPTRPMAIRTSLRSDSGLLSGSGRLSRAGSITSSRASSTASSPSAKRSSSNAAALNGFHPSTSRRSSFEGAAASANAAEQQLAREKTEPKILATREDDRPEGSAELGLAMASKADRLPPAKVSLGATVPAHQQLPVGLRWELDNENIARRAGKLEQNLSGEAALLATSNGMHPGKSRQTQLESAVGAPTASTLRHPASASG